MSTQPLRAFHGDQAVKDKYLARVRAHAAADQLVQGIGWDAGPRGCDDITPAVLCVLAGAVTFVVVLAVAGALP